MDDRLLSRLRCPGCQKPLLLKDQVLVCSACQKTYPLFRNIPLLLESTQINHIWMKYFDDQVEEKGDTIAANSYLTRSHFSWLQQAVLKVIGNIKNLMIIDVGCGTGHFSSALAKENFLVGLDLSLHMLLAAQKKGFQPIQASATALPLACNSFDLVLANSIIQCIACAEKFLTELVRVCAPGGRIIISAFNSQNIFLRLFRYLELTPRPPLFFHPLKKIIDLLTKQGVQNLKIYLLFYPLRFKKEVNKFKAVPTSWLYLASSFVIEAKK